MLLLEVTFWTVNGPVFADDAAVLVCKFGFFSNLIIFYSSSSVRRGFIQVFVAVNCTCLTACLMSWLRISAFASISRSPCSVLSLIDLFFKALSSSIDLSYRSRVSILLRFACVSFSKSSAIYLNMVVSRSNNFQRINSNSSLACKRLFFD